MKITDSADEAVIIGVQIKDSRHGKGLFATRDIPKFNPQTMAGMIMRLDFQKLTPARLHQRYGEGTGPYALKYRDNNNQERIADAMCIRNAPSYANDPRAKDRRTHRIRLNLNKVNAKHAFIQESGELWLVATKPIKKGDEILVSYGPEYWTGHDLVQVRMKYIKAG